MPKYFPSPAPTAAPCILPCAGLLGGFTALSRHQLTPALCASSNAGCLNWVKRPHGDGLGDSARLCVRNGEEQEAEHRKSVSAWSKSPSLPFAYLFCPGVNYQFGYTIAS